MRPIAVVGIGADGIAGLGEAARKALERADLVVGAPRQLALLPASLAAERRTLPTPLAALFAELPGLAAERAVCVLASGDPMLHGIGATLARHFGAEALRVYPHPSALAYVCARLGWPEQEVTLVSAVANSLDSVRRHLQPGRRLCVYTTGDDGPARLGRLLTEAGCGASRAWLCERLGADDERVVATSAAGLAEQRADPLSCVAIEVELDAHRRPLARTPGLPDEAFESDGQLSKWPLRALALAALAPLPGELLWDVGAGSGSVAIEWLRAEPLARAVAIEQRADRAARITRNAERLGVPELRVVVGEAPAALDGLEPPDAVFVGGGVSRAGLLDACVAALRARRNGRARIVAHAVTVEGERALIDAADRYGGELLRIALSDLEPLGTLHGWRPRRPVVQWLAQVGDEEAGR